MDPEGLHETKVKERKTMIAPNRPALVQDNLGRISMLMSVPVELKARPSHTDVGLSAAMVF